VKYLIVKIWNNIPNHWAIKVPFWRTLDRWAEEMERNEE
jgi:hypothetical protein